MQTRGRPLPKLPNTTQRLPISAHNPEAAQYNPEAMFFGGVSNPGDAKIGGSARTHNLVSLRNDGRRTAISQNLKNSLRFLMDSDGFDFDGFWDSDGFSKNLDGIESAAATNN